MVSLLQPNTPSGSESNNDKSLSAPRSSFSKRTPSLVHNPTKKKEEETEQIEGKCCRSLATQVD